MLIHEGPLGHIINGEEVFEGKIVERRNPADRNEVVARYHDGDREILHKAIAAAQTAFEKWRDVPRPERGRIVGRAAALLGESGRQQEFAEVMISEIGKTTAGARGETLKTKKILEHMAGLGTHTSDRVIHADQPGVHMYTRTQPVGIAGLIGPFNFPSAVLAWKAAPAIVAGCAVVVKPSPAAPGTSHLLVKLFEKAGVPPGVINLVYGDKYIATGLVEDPRIKAISFTGSTDAGMALSSLAENRKSKIDSKHRTFEMGGQNALVVLSDADIDRAVEAAINGGFFGEGQRCTATSRLVVEESVYDEFLEKLAARAAKLKIGPGRDPQNEVGPLVSEIALMDVLRAVQDSVRNGMRLVFGGVRLTDGGLGDGNFVAPALLEGNPDNPGHLALHNEIFGPVMGICKVKDLDEAIRVVNGVEHKHAASIYTRDGQAADEFVKRADVGMVHVNNPTIGGDAQAPFGGLGGKTSLGEREMGLNPMGIFLDEKTVDVNWGGANLGRGAR